MATSLASQLQQLATPQTSILDQKRDRRSILFDPSEAAKYGRDVYFDIGQSGYEVLAKTDPAFLPFAESLFGRGSRDLQRAVETREVNTKLDCEVERFLLLLSPYLEKEASLRALEWLVYRFQINEMNQRSLLMCIFPYYESPLFTRVLQVMTLGGEGDEWHWLTGCQKGARPLPKRTIFTRWAGNQAFRNFLADFLKRMMKVRTAQSTPAIVGSFYITTVLGGLGISEVTEEHLSSIVKSLPQCLASGQEHLVSGCYLLLAHLSTKTHLSPSLTASLMELLIQKHPPPPPLTEQCLLCLLAVAHHQSLEELAPPTAAALRRSALLGCLEGLARERSVAALLGPHVLGYVRYLVEEVKEERKTIARFTKFVEELFSLPLSSSDAAKVVWSLYEAISTHHTALLSMPGLQTDVGAAVRALEATHPHGYAQATARLAQRQDDPSSGGKYKKVLRALLLPASDSAPCLTQLFHPQDDLREEASKAFLRRLAQGGEQMEGAMALHICNMLSDDHLPIPLMALSTPAALTTLPAADLAGQCHQLLSKGGKEWQKVKEASLVALSDAVVDRYDKETERMALSICLPYALLPKTTSDLILAKVVLRSRLAERSAFLLALKKEVAPYLDSKGKAKNYNDRVWSAMPKVLSGLSATDLLALCEVLEGQAEECYISGSNVMVLALLHASLGVKGDLALKMAHKLTDLCLAVLAGAKAPASAPPPSDSNTWGTTQVLAPHRLHAYLAQVRRGDLPVNLLVTCVLQVCQVFRLPPPCTETPYWSPLMEREPGEGHLLLLVKAVKAALGLEGAGTTHGRDAVLVKVFKECLPDPKSQFYFLALIWGWQSSLPFSDVIDEALQTWTLALGKALLIPHTPAANSLAWALGTQQPLVPALLSALTSCEEGVRRGAIECLRALGSVRGGSLAADSYAEVIRVILGQAEELVADASQLAALLSCGQSASANGCRVKQVTQCLLGVAVAGKELPPTHIRAAVLFAVTAATDTAVLQNLLPLAEYLLDEAEKMIKEPRKEEEEESEKGKLDVSSSLCLLYILQRYTAETTQVLETEAGWRVFERVLGSARACLRVHEDCVAPQAILLQEVLSSRFLTSIRSEVMRSKIWTMLVTRVTLSDDPQEARRLRHALRQVTMDAEVIAGQIDDLELTPKVTSLHTARVKRMKMKEGDGAQQQAWHRLRLMLETLPIMGCLRRPWLLVAPLSQCLKLTLSLDLTSTTLLQQQILSTLLHILEKSVEEVGEEEVSRRVQVNVEVIVACVRASLSHDTHRRALLILALCARIVPDAVLHNMMAIFTFMGTSLLRRDDAHSFQVIHHTIENIVPTLLQYQGKKDKGLDTGVEVRLAQVCQVFVDALPDLPHHRRLPLFTQLAATIRPDSNLWLLLALLADSYVMRGSGGVEEEERCSLPQVIQFSLALAAQFPAATQVGACVKLMSLVSTLPEDRETTKAQQQQQHMKKQGKKAVQEERMEVVAEGAEEVQVISLASFHSPRQILHFKYTVTGLVAHLLASEKFVGKVYEVEEQVNEVKVLQALYRQLLEVTLCFLHAVTTACELHKDKPAGRHLASLQRKVVEALEGLVALLPPSSLLQVCQELLSSPVALVRCRAAELISAKLQPHLNYFRSDDAQPLQDTMQMLCHAAVNKQEAVDIRQTYLFSLQLLARHLSQGTPPPHTLQLVLTTAVDVVCDDGEELRVVTQGLLVAAEAVAALQVASVGCLGRLMPALTKMLVATTSTTPTALSTTTTTTTAAAAATTAATTQLLATLTALHKVIDSLPQLLSPYLEEVIKQVCCIWTGEEGITTTTGKESKVAGKLLAVREALVRRVEPRILVPKLVKAFHSLLTGDVEGDLAPLHSLVMMVGWLVRELSPQALPLHRPALLALLTDALDLRSLRGDSKGVEEMEEAVFTSLSRLLLRLPEQDNVSIFSSLVSWAAPLFLTPAATPTAIPQPARLISFYRFANHLVDTYKVLFLVAHLAEALLAPTAALLMTVNSAATPPVFGRDEAAARHTCMLLEAVLDTLTKAFTHDSVGFVTPERFGLLCAPLTDLLDNMVGGAEAYRRRVHIHLSPCLTHMARAVGDDSLWRDLAAQVLMRLRDEDRPQVVLGALEVFGSLVEGLGEDFLRPLLADTIPPITEALESSNPEVESATRALFTKMEEVIGDQMRAYLDH